jgi:NAD(P)-dependent dehydrogenase (short-subunit alcohol dehydrogenase family)
MQIKRSCALITGAGSGLGRAAAEALHGAGAVVLVADIDIARAESVTASLGDRSLAVGVDVRDCAQVVAAVSLAKERFGGLQIVVNCAGIAASAKTIANGEPHSLEDWCRVIDVNLTGTFNVLRHAALQMIHNLPDSLTGERGIIINTASIAGLEGQRGQAAYAASKAGVIALSQPVARDLAEYRIRCVAIAPGLFETELLKGIPTKGLQALQRGLLYPDRAGHPSEFGAFARHVIENPYLNGVCLRLDGGARLT